MSAPEPITAARQPIADRSGRLPMAAWLVASAYVGAMLWLTLGSRAYIDEIWLAEFGRIRLAPDSDHSMYMFADGSSLRFLVDGGPLLSDWLFRHFESLSAFRVVNIGGMLLLAGSVRALAVARGVPPALAAWLSFALLLDPTLMQSVVLGRPDALAIGICAFGLWLADHGYRAANARGPAWHWIAAGYCLSVAALSVWISVAFVGPLVFAHWLAAGVRLGSVRGQRAWVALCFLLLPLCTLVATVDLWHLWDVFERYANDPVLPIQPNFAELWRAPELMAVSGFILLPGMVSIALVRPRWLGLVLAAALFPIFLSGFYPFRIPYLLAIAVAAIAVVLSQTTDPVKLRAWNRLLALATLVAFALATVRLGFSFSNEHRLTTADSLVSRLPKGTKVADFSWDFYETGRLAGMKMMRTYPAIDGHEVARWLQRVQPDLVIRAVNPLGSWVMVADLDSRLREAAYCEAGWFDHRGDPWPPARPARPVPSPLLWRLGLYRDHGPYMLWIPCDQTGG